MSAKICVIAKNKLFYSKLDRTFSKLTEDNIELDIEDYLEFKTVEKPHLMEEIVTIFNNPDLTVNTYRVFEDPNYIYELCYQVNDENKADVNNIASQLIHLTDRVVGNAILIKSRINYDRTCDLTDISVSNVIDIYKQLFVHIGVTVSGTGIVDEYRYILNPLDFAKPEQMQNTRFYEYRMFNRVIQMFIEIEPSVNHINEIGTILHKKAPVYGKIYLAMRYTFDDMRMTEDEYCDLNKNLLNQIICYASVTDIESMQTVQDQVAEKDKEKEKEAKDKKVNTFYTKLTAEYNKYLEKYGSSPQKTCIETVKNNETLNMETKKMLEKANTENNKK